MSLSPFDSFQSRFVTYLLNFPRINCELMVEVMKGYESKLLTCANNTFCLIAVTITEITFVGLLYSFVRFC